MLQALLEARRLGLAVPATLLVKAYLDAHGGVPKTKLAHELDVSVRTVERAMAELKALGIPAAATSASTTSVSHDHASGKHLNNHPEHGTKHEPATPVTDGGDLEAALLAADVLPWCARVILEKCDPAAVRRQLAYHAYRLANGFQARTEGGAAKALFRACLNDWPAPKGYFERQERASVAAAAPVAPPPATPRRARLARCKASGLTFPVRHWFGDGCVLDLPDGDRTVVEAEKYGLYDWLDTAC